MKKQTYRFFLDSRRPLKGSKLFPLKLVIYNPREQKTAMKSVGVALTEAQFKAFDLNQTSKGDYLSIDPGAREELRSIQASAEMLCGRKPPLKTDDLFEKILSGKYTSPNSVIEAIERRVLDAKNSLKDQESFKTTSTHLINFLGDPKGDFNLRGIMSLKSDDKHPSAQKAKKLWASAAKFSFDSITHDWLVSFEKYLLQRGSSDATVSVNMRNLKTIYNEAKLMDRALIETYPFGRHGYTIKQTAAALRALFSEDIIKIKRHIPANPVEEYAKDFWLFSFFSNGLNFKDVAQLDWADFDRANKTISFIRKKSRGTKTTSTPITFGINQFQADVIEKYGTPEGPKGLIFHFVPKSSSPSRAEYFIKKCLERINKGMQSICKAQNTEEVTYQAARHSFAAICHYEERLPMMELKDLLGHSSIITTQKYLERLPKRHLGTTSQSRLDRLS